MVEKSAVWLVFLGLMMGGCGSVQTPTADEATEALIPASKEVAIDLSGGDFARLGRMVLRPSEFVKVPAAACQEAFVFVEDGEVLVTDQEGIETTLKADDAVSFADAQFQVAPNKTSIVAFALVRPLDHPFGDPFAPPIDEEVCGTPRGLLRSSRGETLEAAGGALHVNIVFDEAAGAKHGAFSLLSAPSALDIPAHRHATSVEAIYIVDGKGKMLVGTDVTPTEGRQVMYVPQNEKHGFESSSGLTAYQVYAPFGPEQRFRKTP